MKQRRHSFRVVLIESVLCAVVLCAVLWAVVPASAGRIDFNWSVCVELADILEPERTWIPVGCEATLCCQGCPDAPIDWRIRVSGDPLDSVLLQFENLPPEAARKLVIKGKARWEGNALRVRPGETVVSGFKSDPRAVPAVATPRLFANKERLQRLQEAAEREDAAPRGQAAPAAKPGAGRDLGRMEVVVEQLMGKYVVNEARVVYNVRRCRQGGANNDHFLLNNNIGSDNVVAILDARNGNNVCLEDEDYRGVGAIFVGDLRTSEQCTSETAIFSDDNAMWFLTPTLWTSSLSDEKIANLLPILEAPVAVWLADPNPTPGTPERAEWEMATANHYYNSQNAGIAFDATYTDVSANGDAVRLIGAGCSRVGQIKASSFYRPNQLNVYYVDNGPTQSWRGKTCWQADPTSASHEPNIIFIDRRSRQETLAHEFGHSFSLDHPDEDGIMGINMHNLMWSGGSMRTIISLGQAFRMNVNVTSMLNVNGVRTGFTRDPSCADTTTNPRCPHLALDVTPK
ncbi:MAG TPA: hypothetical protein VF240_10000 [Pyrinomonadaceae bacterium]